MNKQGFVYILTNKNNSTLYIGVTSAIVKRIYEHKNKVVEGFSKKYNLNKLVYFEQFDDMETAITREKYLKGKTRKYKNDLINSINPDWNDLYGFVCGESWDSSGDKPPQNDDSDAWDSSP